MNEAQELHVKVLDARMQVLGSSHPDTLGSMNTLLEIYLSQGKQDEADRTKFRVQNSESIL